MGGLVDEVQLEEQKPLLSPEEEVIVTSTSSGDEAEGSGSEEEIKGNEDDDFKHTKIKTKDIGIWRIYYQDARFSFLPGYETVHKFKEVLGGLPYVLRFIRDVWSFAPGHLIIWGFIRLWDAVQGTISLWCTAYILQTIQDIVVSGKSDMPAVRRAFILKFSLGILSWLLELLSKNIDLTLEQRGRDHCGTRLLDAYTRMDLVTLQRKDVQKKLNAMSDSFLGGCIWEEFTQLVGQMAGLAEVASQGAFLVQFFRSQQNGLALSLVCILPQIAQVLLYRDSLGDTWFAYATNQAYVRARSVGDTAKDKRYFEEIVGSGLYRYLQNEYHKAQSQLKGVSCGSVWQVIYEQSKPWTGLIKVGLEDFSLMYYLMVVALDPSSFSLTSLTVMRETAQSVLWTIWRLFDRDDSLNKGLRFLRDYYSLLEMKNDLLDGLIPYPAKESLELQGMKIEFRNVSMKYPKSNKFALRNVSFTIPAGATVILVGENGSGKTTTVSLLSRLFDATSGEILIDDRPISDYQVQTLREAQAILRQGYQHFPFSIKENIGI
ncbi:hypothetical protein FS842_001733, partial [Serendipita sp. 407]